MENSDFLLRTLTVVCEPMGLGDGLVIPLKRIDPGRYPVRVSSALSDTNAARAALDVFMRLHSDCFVAPGELSVECELGEPVNDEYFAEGDMVEAMSLGVC